MPSKLLAFSVVLALAAGARAQPTPPPLPPGHSAPQAQSWQRLTLDDGRVIDVQVVGFDATNLHGLALSGAL